VRAEEDPSAGLIPPSQCQIWDAGRQHVEDFNKTLTITMSSARQNKSTRLKLCQSAMECGADGEKSSLTLLSMI
jgi:hypothetical protein